MKRLASFSLALLLAGLVAALAQDADAAAAPIASESLWGMLQTGLATVITGIVAAMAALAKTWMSQRTQQLHRQALHQAAETGASLVLQRIGPERARALTEMSPELIPGAQWVEGAAPEALATFHAVPGDPRLSRLVLAKLATLLYLSPSSAKPGADGPHVGGGS